MTPMSQFEDRHRDDDQHAMGEGEVATASTRIWGTNVSVETCMHVFRNFLRNFNPPSSGAPGPLSHYMRQLHVLHRTQGAAFNLNCSHLYDHIASRSLYRQLQVKDSPSNDPSMMPHMIFMRINSSLNVF
jgi:hypothetical protein